MTASDGVPVHRQIVNQVKDLVAAGRLADGEQMPSVRKLAEQLVVKPNTVARAYCELETTLLWYLRVRLCHLNHFRKTTNGTPSFVVSPDSSE